LFFKKFLPEKNPPERPAGIGGARILTATFCHRFFTAGANFCFFGFLFCGHNFLKKSLTTFFLIIAYGSLIETKLR
jgi:hypothetical protein